MQTINQTIAKHNAYQDSMLHVFESHLHQIVSRAQARTIAKLSAKLAMTDGVIDPTPGNMQQLRNAGQLFLKELDDAGYPRLVNAFVGEFKGTLPFLDQTVEALGNQVGQDWRVAFTARDFGVLAAAQTNTAWSIADAMQAASGAAVKRGLYGLGGLRFGSLVELLQDRLQMGVAQAMTAADTGMSVFYRTASDRAFQIIAKDLPEQALNYEFSGPSDKLERPWCRHMTEANKVYTRAQIDLMDNGQFPVGSVFLTVGGWRCRHMFILSTRDLEAPAEVVEVPAVAAP